MELKGTDNIRDIWPNIELYMHGGVSFKPYQKQFEKIIPTSDMNYVETYNASEGFFGIQDELGSDEMLLMLDYGIFYEFLPVEELGSKNPKTLSLNEVELGKNYALIISTNAGLWRYMVGDTVRFTSKFPFRVQVSGRTKHYINAFGEELIVENSDFAIQQAAQSTGALVSDYTAAPIYMGDDAKGAHEWAIEFDHAPNCLHTFAKTLDDSLKSVNTDYEAKRAFDLNLRAPVVHVLPKGTFYNWLKSQGKLGGQHKIPRLSNDRVFIEQVLKLHTAQL
jgi:hypothetical protein